MNLVNKKYWMNSQHHKHDCKGLNIPLKWNSILPLVQKTKNRNEKFIQILSYGKVDIDIKHSKEKFPARLYATAEWGSYFASLLVQEDKDLFSDSGTEMPAIFLLWTNSWFVRMLWGRKSQHIRYRLPMRWVTFFWFNDFYDKLLLTVMSSGEVVLLSLRHY